MKYTASLLLPVAILLFGCAEDADDAEDSEVAKAEATATCLASDTLYYYRSAFPEFKERLNWIAETTQAELQAEVEEAKKGNKRIKDTLVPLLTGDVIGAVLASTNWHRSDDGKHKLLWIWESPWADPTDAPFENHAEKVMRSLPKLQGEREWSKGEFENLEFTTGDPAHELIGLLSEYTLAASKRAKEVQPKIKVTEHAGAMVFRSSDKCVILIAGVKWNHPLYADGYTEFRCTISQVTGEVVSDQFSYTTFPLEPGEFTQWAEIADVAAKTIITAARLIGNGG